MAASVSIDLQTIFEGSYQITANTHKIIVNVYAKKVCIVGIIKG